MYLRVRARALLLFLCIAVLTTASTGIAGCTSSDPSANQIAANTDSPSDVGTDPTLIADADDGSPQSDTKTPEPDVQGPDANAGGPVADAGSPDADPEPPDADADPEIPDADTEGPDTDTWAPDVDEEEPETEAQFEAFFTYPEPDEPDDAIEESIIDLIDNAPSTATIRAAFYTFSQTEVAESFADALERGVDVRIVLGNTSKFPDGNDWSAVTILRNRLGDRLTICQDGEDDGGCLGQNIQHNKFVTFSELEDGSTDAVVLTSSNMTDFQQSQYNHSVLVHSDPALYDAFYSYWEDLQQDERDPQYDRLEQGDADIHAYFSPLSSGDPILDDLQDVDCEQGADVYVAMAFFTNSRSDIAQELRAMDADGCGVHLVLRERPQINSPGVQIMGHLKNGDIDIGLFPEEEQVQLHSKYMLVDGAYGPDAQPQRIVWTGSANFTISALRYNDEAVVKIADDDVFDAYYDDWQHIRQQAPTVHP